MSATIPDIGPDCPASITLIMDLVTEHYRLGPLDLISESQSRRSSHPRMIVCWLARDLTTMSATQIGRAIERDRTTVDHGIRTITYKANRDQAFKAELSALRAKCVAALPAWKRLPTGEAAEKGRFGVTRRAHELVSQLARKVTQAIERDPIRFVVEMGQVADRIVDASPPAKEAADARH